MKKTLALALALAMALCAMSVSAFAVSFDFEDDSVGDWTTHGGTENLSVVDGALLTTGRWNGAFKTAYSLGDLAAGTYEVVVDIYAPVSDMDIDGAITYTINIVNGEGAGNLDGPNYASEKFVITSGEWTTISYIFVLDADVTDAILAVNTFDHDPWARNPEFSIDNVYFGIADTTDNVTVTDEPVEENPIEVDTQEEAPAETPAEDEAPAETGLALAIVPMIVAMAAAALTKKR